MEIYALLDIATFIETFFYNPNGLGHVKLYDWQREFIRVVQYGRRVNKDEAPNCIINYTNSEVSQRVAPIFGEERYPPKKFTLVKAPRGSAKSFSIQAFVAAVSIMMPGISIIYVSVAQVEATKSVTNIRTFIENSIFGKMLPKRSAMDKFRLDNGSTIHAYPISPSVRGSSCEVLVADEVAHIPPKFMKEDLIPVLRLTFQYQKALFASTPYGTSGFYYEQWMDEMTNKTYDKFAVKDILATDNNGNLIPEDCVFAVPGMTAEDYLERSRIAGHTGTLQELNAEFVSDATAVFKDLDILASFDRLGYLPIVYPLIKPSDMKDIMNLYGRLEAFDYRNVQPSGVIREPPAGFPFMNPKENPVVLGIDLGQHNDPTVFGIFTQSEVIIDVVNNEQIKRECINLVWMESYLGMKYPDQLARVLKLIERYQPTLLVCDGNSQGEPFLQFLEPALNEWSVNTGFTRPRIYHNRSNKAGLAVVNNTVKEPMIKNLAARFESGEIRIPYYDRQRVDIRGEIHYELHQLERELREFRVEKTDAGNKRYVSNIHDDRVITFAMVAYALMGYNNMGSATGKAALLVENAKQIENPPKNLTLVEKAGLSQVVSSNSTRRCWSVAGRRL